MKIFISWSGERSQILAQALHEWLPMVLHYVEPWLSRSDIGAGERWATEVAKELEATKFGIICITRENIASPWILFESGALAKSMQEGRVIPLLLDVEFKDIAGPLAQFQAKKVEEDGLRDVVNSINQLSETKLADPRLSSLFAALWPQLEKKAADIPRNPATAKHSRPEKEILEELVSSIRGLDMKFRETVEEAPRSRRRRHRFHPMMLQEMLHGMELGRKDPIRYLFIASSMKDDFPWIYELGVDAYRSTIAASPKAKEARHRFFSAINLLRRGPFLEMGFGSDKESYHFMRELMHLLEEELHLETDGEIREALKEFERPNARKPVSTG